jgi:serine/threonine protein phosphatase PrpC
MASSTGSFDISALSDIGRGRKDNQDCFARAESLRGEQGQRLRAAFGRLYIVADGVGGNDDGDIASQMVVDYVMEYFYHRSSAPRQAIERLRYAIEHANQDVHAAATSRGNNMASTIVAALIHDDMVTVANVGDSPALLFRRGAAPKQLTVDHVGADSAGAALLTQAIGDPEVQIALATERFEPGDILVLCSDGLTDLVTSEEIRRVVHENSAREASRKLIRLANERGGYDNITALVVRNGRLPFFRQEGFLQIAVAVVAVAMLVALLYVLVSFLLDGDLGTNGNGALTASPAYGSRTPSASSGAIATPTIPITPTVTLEPTNINTPLPPPPTKAPISARTQPAPRPTQSVPITIQSSEPVTTSVEPSPVEPPTAAPAPLRVFQAKVVTSYPDTGPVQPDQHQSCVRGQVVDRGSKGIAHAVLYVNNGEPSESNVLFETNSKGNYVHCELGASRWSVVLTYIPGEPGLAREAVGVVHVNGSQEQDAIVNFQEQE